MGQAPTSSGGAFMGPPPERPDSPPGLGVMEDGGTRGRGVADSSATHQGMHGRAGQEHTDVGSKASLARPTQPRHRAKVG